VSDTDRDRLVARLKEIHADPTLDTEEEHVAADQALVEFINDAEVARAYDAISKWYA